MAVHKVAGITNPPKVVACSQSWPRHIIARRPAPCRTGSQWSGRRESVLENDTGRYAKRYVEQLRRAESDLASRPRVLPFRPFLKRRHHRVQESVCLEGVQGS